MLLAGLGLTLATLHTAPPAELPRAPLPPGPEPCAWAVWQDKQDDPDPWATEFKNIQKQVYGMQKEYNTTVRNQKCVMVHKLLGAKEFHGHK